MIYRIKNFKLSKAIVPNTFTALNLFFGFVSIVLASQGKINLAAQLIFVSAVFDLLDGMIARFMKSTSAFGVELDSLADLVSFGAAPSYLAYKSYLYQFDIWGIILSAFPLIFGAFRLARFNIQIEDLSVKSDFKGLAIPIQALTIASFTGFYYQNGEIIQPFDFWVIPLVIVLSFLMVTNIRYNRLPKPSELETKMKIIAILFIVAGLSISICTNGEALFYIFLFIVLFGVIRQLFVSLFGK